MKRSTMLLIIIFIPSVLFCQYLVPNINIESERIGSSYQSEIEELQQNIIQYIRSEKFSNEDYDFQIPYRITIFIRSIDEGGSEKVYTCEAFFTNEYDQRYYDPQWKFVYDSGVSLFRSTGIADPLTDLIDYYGYIIVGVELDAIELMGGNPIFENAEQIIQKSQSSRWNQGWRSRAKDLEELTRNYRLRKARYYLSEAFWAVDDGEEEEAVSKLKDSLRLINEIIRIKNKDKFTDDFIEVHYKDAEFFISTLQDTSFLPLYREIMPQQKAYFDNLVQKYF